LQLDTTNTDDSVAPQQPQVEQEMGCYVVDGTDLVDTAAAALDRQRHWMDFVNIDYLAVVGAAVLAVAAAVAVETALDNSTAASSSDSGIHYLLVVAAVVAGDAP